MTAIDPLLLREPESSLPPFRSALAPMSLTTQRKEDSPKRSRKSMLWIAPKNIKEIVIRGRQSSSRRGDSMGRSAVQSLVQRAGAGQVGVDGLPAWWRGQRRDRSRRDIFRWIEIEVHQGRVLTGPIALEDCARRVGGSRIDRAPTGKTGSQYFQRQYGCCDLDEALMRLLRASCG